MSHRWRIEHGQQTNQWISTREHLGKVLLPSERQRSNIFTRSLRVDGVEVVYRRRSEGFEDERELVVVLHEEKRGNKLSSRAGLTRLERTITAREKGSTA